MTTRTHDDVVNRASWRHGGGSALAMTAATAGGFFAVVFLDAGALYYFALLVIVGYTSLFRALREGRRLADRRLIWRTVFAVIGGFVAGLLIVFVWLELTWGEEDDSSGPISVVAADYLVVA